MRRRTACWRSAEYSDSALNPARLVFLIGSSGAQSAAQAHVVVRLRPDLDTFPQADQHRIKRRIKVQHRAQLERDDEQTVCAAVKQGIAADRKKMPPRCNPRTRENSRERRGATAPGLGPATGPGAIDRDGEDPLILQSNSFLTAQRPLYACGAGTVPAQSTSSQWKVVPIWRLPNG
jgi:hypothetical protein